MGRLGEAQAPIQRIPGIPADAAVLTRNHLAPQLGQRLMVKPLSGDRPLTTRRINVCYCVLLGLYRGLGENLPDWRRLQLQRFQQRLA